MRLTDSPAASGRFFSSLRKGHPNAALAKMLWVTEQTVKFHLSNIYGSSTPRTALRRAGGHSSMGLLPETSARFLIATG
jgi:hypothetical protein